MSASRTRRCRARKQRGIRVVKVEVDLEAIDALVEARFLPAWDAENATAIEAAVQAMLNRVTRYALDEGSKL